MKAVLHYLRYSLLPGAAPLSLCAQIQAIRDGWLDAALSRRQRAILREFFLPAHHPLFTCSVLSLSSLRELGSASRVSNVASGI